VKRRGALTTGDRGRLCREAAGAFWDALWFQSSGGHRSDFSSNTGDPGHLLTIYREPR
jgi:hypothetical protein